MAHPSDELDCPPGFHRVPARCRCGVEFWALSVRPAKEGEPPRDRRCDLCAFRVELDDKIAKKHRAKPEPEGRKR